MAGIKYILTPGDEADRMAMGGKAAALAELDVKFPIPKWFVVTPQAFIDCLSSFQKQKMSNNEPLGEILIQDSVAKVIEDSLLQLELTKKSLFAVRSSATSEDGASASFAGQLESFLNVPSEGVINKVREVWNSAFTEHVRQYRQVTNGDDENWVPAVVVQRMVQADVAGVAFSVDPVSADQDTCVINAVQGLADELVSGKVNGDIYYTGRDGTVKKQDLIGQSSILKEEVIQEIVGLLLKVEKHFKVPQDIEWAIQDGKLFLLQARPITSLKNPSLAGNNRIIWDNSNIVESYSGVTSPLTFSFARYIYEHVYIQFCKIMGVSRKEIKRENNIFRNMLGFVNGHVYYNLLSWYRVLALFPGFKMNQKFMEQMMGVKEPLPEELINAIVPSKPNLVDRIIDTLNFGKTVIGLVINHLMLPRNIRLYYRRLNYALAETGETLQDLPLDKLALEYRKLEQKLLNKWDAPLVNDFFCMMAFGISRKLLEKYAGEEGLALHNDIMIGQGDIISAEPARRIQAMAEIASDDSDLVEVLISGKTKDALAAIEDNLELKNLYEAHLEKFGDRCLQELKLESPTLHDDPSSLLMAIGYMARRPNPKKVIEEANPKEKLASLKVNPIQKYFISSTVKWAKSRVRDRENLRFERTRLFGRVRKIFLEIGKRLHDLGYINDPREIFFLEVPEVTGFVEGTLTTYDLSKLVALRKEQQEYFKSLPSPPNRLETKGAVYHAFKSGVSTLSKISDAGTNGLNTRKGIGCCPGIVKASVRVISDPREAELKSGEIMVAQFTDPGWITLFANAAGILVERGSLLSHSAIVAREMDIPAIVALDGVMSWLKNGDVVEMNGATGVVTKSSR